MKHANAQNLNPELPKSSTLRIIDARGQFVIPQKSATIPTPAPTE